MLKRLPILVLLMAVSAFSPLAETRDPVQLAIEDGRFEEARKLLEGGSGGRAEGERLELLTEVCNALGDYAAGIRYGKQAVARSPRSSNAHLQHAIAVRTKMQNVSPVKAMFSTGTYKKGLRRARELDPKNLDAREEEIGFLTHAPGVAGGDVKRARELAAELAALAPRRGLMMQIEIESAKGTPASATALFRQALAAEPDDHGLRARFGLHLQQQKQFRDADAEFERLLEADNLRAARGALYQRARTRVLGRYEQDRAVGFLRQYLDAVPRDQPGLPTPSNAYWRMGNAHEQLKQTAEARAAYLKALELDSDNKEARQALKSLGSPAR